MAEDVHFQTMQTNRVRSYHTRQSLDASRAPLNGPAPATLMDKFALLPILACVFALIVSPLLLFLTDLKTLESQTLASDARPENRIFWPALAAISLVLVVRNRSRLTLPSNIICLLAYLAFAGASVLWAFSPESSFVRFIQEVMIVSSIALPAMLASRTADMMRGLFLCFALALMLNVFFVLAGNSTIVSYGSKLVDIGYEGYFEGKNYLGECAAIALLLSLYELHQRGWRRVSPPFCAHRHLTHLVERSKNSVWLGVGLPAACCAYADGEKGDAPFSRHNPFQHTAMLRASFQPIKDRYSRSHILHIIP